MEEGAGWSGGGPARKLLASTRCMKVCWKEFIVNDNCWIDVAPYILPWSMGIIMILICVLYVTQIEWDNFSNHKKFSTYHFVTIAGVNCPTQRQLTPYFIAHIAIPGVNFPTQGKFTPFFLIFFLEKLRQLTHVVGTLSHKGIARRALPASGGKDVDGGNRKVNKGEWYSCV